jgi:hypothetical protein
MVQTHPTVQTPPNQTMPRKKLKRRIEQQLAKFDKQRTEKTNTQ